MLGVKIGIVDKIIQADEEITELLVKINNQESRAINYNTLTGKVKTGDRLLLNTTAIDLKLGTGGYHFVIANMEHIESDFAPGGHIMKLRYSPFQLKVFAAEEQDSPYHHLFNSFEGLAEMPVIIGTLHSMVEPVAILLKHDKPLCRIAYIMTDGAALPIAFSNSIKRLKKQSMIVGTITIGNAFGGDLDCVNIYNGLIAAKEILKCDMAIVAMGPGIVGTGTQYGFTGIEQGNIIDAVNDLGGKAIAIPRISFADPRPRHQGISHHSLTVLSKIAKTSAHIAIPFFEEQKRQIIYKQLDIGNISKNHMIHWIDESYIFEQLKTSSSNLRSMGRGLQEDPDFFTTAGAAARFVTEYPNDC